MQAGLLIAGRSGSCFVQDNGVLIVIAEIVGVDKLGAWPSEAHPHPATSIVSKTDVNFR
jgi:hypothetical protein